MSNRLEVPPELKHLIEKRELDDRREAERRKELEQSTAPSAEADDSESTEPANELGADENLECDRRGGDERRQTIRRTADRDALDEGDRSA